MPRKPKRRFVDLDTVEVSLVDRPANEVSFLVKKNQESNMEPNTEQTTGNTVATVPVDSGGETNEVAKALEHVNGIVGEIKKMVLHDDSDKGNKDASKETETAKSQSEGSSDNTDNGNTEEDDISKATIKGVLAKAGLSGDALDKACQKLQKAGFDPNMKFPSAKPPITKADESESQEESEPEDEPLTMNTFVDAVNKAARFTPTRINQLKQVQELLKLVLESVAPNASPKTKVPGVESHGNPSAVNELASPKKKPVMKSESELALVDTLKSLGEAVAGMNERLEAIEKKRNGSNSAEEEGGTDTNTEKSANIWKGLL